MKNIILIGNVASGKTTLMPHLAKILNAGVVDADNLFQTSNPFAKQFLADMQRWALTCELWMTYERLQIMNRAINENQDRNLLVDSGLPMSWVYAYSHFANGIMSQQEWDLYSKLYDDLTQNLHKNVQIIRLKYPINLLMERLKKRGRDYELKYYTEDYLNRLENGIDAFCQKFEKENVSIVTLTQAEIGDLDKNGFEIEKIKSKINA